MEPGLSDSQKKALSTSTLEAVKDTKVVVWPNIKTRIPCGYVYMWVYALPCSRVYTVPSLHTFTYVHMSTLPLSQLEAHHPQDDEGNGHEVGM